MKKGIIKWAVFMVVFVASLFIFSRLLNTGTNDMTMDMEEPKFPVVYMGMGDIRYNEMHGYVNAMDTTFMRDTITVLDENRSTQFFVDTYGDKVQKFVFEVRSVDGERLIESTEVTDYETTAAGIFGTLTAKDLLETGKEYEMVLLLTLDTGNTARYYTRLVWGTDYHAYDKLSFARDFNNKTFDKEQAQDLAKYMETNSTGDNSTLHKVDIHCSLNQVTWGNLEVKKVTSPVFQITEIASQTAVVTAHYVVSTGSGKQTSYFYVEEYYRLRYTTDRIYLLDYNRTMNSILQEESDIYVNDKIVIGIADENLPIYESEDGNIFAFVVQDRLYSYNVTTNKMTVVFGFYRDEYTDARKMDTNHDIRVLNIDEGGNLQFAVAGYMDRGSHEGEVGVQVYNYDSSYNTVEEKLYIPYNGNYRILKAELDELLYLNREGYLYTRLNNAVLEINLEEMTCSYLLKDVEQGSMWVSDSGRIAVWQTGGSLYEATGLTLMDFGTRKKITVNAGTDEYILPLGFMEEDLIYGITRREDIIKDNAGRITFPMYTVSICNSKGITLKKYSQDNIYVTACSINGGQITLDRVLKTESGSFAETTQEHIMSSTKETVGKNTVSTVVTENYGKYVQIAVKKEIDRKALQVRSTKEIMYEGSRDLLLPETEEKDAFYVYEPDGSAGVYKDAAAAVKAAEELSGVVLNKAGDYVWMRGNRAVKNQIMSIKAENSTEETSSLAVCLNVMLKKEGITRNTEYWLDRGENIYSLLEENLSGAQILDLKGCSLDSVLYYVNRDIPVLACLNDGNAVLITGFNQYNVVIMDPSKGTLAKMGMNDATDWFAENGNAFITYMKYEQ